ncbi:DcrB-related protein [Hyalangium versicolor]|uniref:DcrB-related protein n=1 Tax=Hyalangium versicolor TaxID=2861190 RepID=UPI001CD03F54|nr:DcrB-related protein [Hyalangium versicolor]
MNSRTMNYGSLQMSLPDGWTDATQIVATGPVEDGFRSSMAYVAEPLRPRETPPQFAARMLALVSRTTEQFQMVAERPATFGNVPGFFREFTHVARGVKLAQLQFFVMREGVVHMFTFTQKAERMQATRHVAEKLFASVNLGAAPAAAPSTSASAPAPAMPIRPRPSRYIEPRHMRIIAA